MFRRRHDRLMTRFALLMSGYGGDCGVDVSKIRSTVSCAHNVVNEGAEDMDNRAPVSPARRLPCDSRASSMDPSFITIGYNFWIVGLSFVIASFASYVALDLAKRVRSNDAVMARGWWIGG